MRQFELRAVEIVNRRLPAGWCIVWRLSTPGCRGYCSFERKEVHTPFVLTRSDLFVALHEIAHACIHHQNKMAKHVEEYEAERLAILMMRSEGIAVPKIELASARENVLEKIREDETRGFRIDRAALKWATRRSK